jgi:MOSC domain-containing protein YiiM
MNPTVVALFLCKASRAPLVSVDQVEAIENTGLEGDRHAKRDSRRQVLLMEEEILDRLDLKPGDVREQVTVRDLGLDALEDGARIRVGGALLEVGAPCQPCERMDQIRAGLKDALVGRRGRFVSVVEAGSFSVGDPLVVEPPV